MTAKPRLRAPRRPGFDPQVARVVSAIDPAHLAVLGPLLKDRATRNASRNRVIAATKGSFYDGMPAMTAAKAMARDLAAFNDTQTGNTSKAFWLGSILRMNANRPLKFLSIYNAFSETL